MDSLRHLCCSSVSEFIQAVWTGPKFPNASCPPSSCNCSTAPAKPNDKGGSCVAVDCSHGCLYDVRSDPGEHRDVSASNAPVVKLMKARIKILNATAFSPQRGLPDARGCATALAQGGFWGPFL